MSDVKAILAERGKAHGDFTDHARFAQELKGIAYHSGNWEKLTSVQAEALEMILHKVARILAGNPNHQDHWDDIAGYATLVSERLDSGAPKGVPAGKPDRDGWVDPGTDAKSARPFVANTPRGKDDPRVRSIPEQIKAVMLGEEKA